MKNIIALILLLQISSTVSGSEKTHFAISGVDSLDNSKSFIHTETMLVPEADSALHDIKYFDGLGKPIQTVRQEISPTKGDLVSFFTYDSMGRVSKEWLPLHIHGNKGGFLSEPFDDIVNQYADNAPFQYTEYDHLPESRIVLRQEAGEVWNLHPVHTQYLINDETGVLKCLRYKVNDDGTLFKDEAYDPGELRVVKTTDEDGKSSHTFIDKMDRTVLVREVNGSEQYDTYHVYDVKGNLCYVLSPMYQENSDSGLFAYRYVFNNRNLCMMKIIPGNDSIRYAYDKADRLICSQNDRQSLLKEWSFSVSDPKGREAITGIGTSSSTLIPSISNALVTARRSQESGSMDCGYTLSGLSGMVNTQLKKVIYYDDYDYLSGLESETARLHLDYSVNDFPSWLKNKKEEFSAVFTNPTGLQTGKRMYLEDNSYLSTLFYYDKKERIIQQRSTNHLGGYDIDFYSYTFTGLVKGHVHVHLASDAKVILEEYYNYVYDHGLRLKQVLYQLNGGQEVQLSENEYDKLCRIRSVKMNGGTIVLDYNYNIRNWITSINSPYFKQYLNYTNGMGNPCYNGNISSMTWQVNTSEISGYKFSYDGLNRMTEAIYGEGNSLCSNPNRFNEQVTGYDGNGNILGLKRYGLTSQNDYSMIDNLSMSYNGNRLLAVKDNALSSVHANNFSFTDDADKMEEYFYDPSGNLIKDLNKKIVDIQYNYLNLPSRIVFENGNNISYLYSPEGVKLRTKHVAGDEATTTDYCGNVIYENGIPAKLLTEVGYVNLADTIYHYFLLDHQGNNRVVISENGNVEETNHYYPFGGLMASSSGSIQDYKYNGKELDRKNGLDWYDYGARYYDPAIGRWNAVDLMAEKYYGLSLYSYCNNNPVNLIDPTGNVFTRYQDQYGNLLANTSDGSQNVVTVPNNRTDEFKKHLLFTSDYLQSSQGWNDYWADEFKGTEAFKPTPEQQAILDMQHSDWARKNGIEYLKEPNLWNWLKYVGSEVLSQYTDPELVAGGLSAGIMGLNKPTVQNSGYTFTKSAGKHMSEFVKKGMYKGELSRPYMNWSLPVNEIMATGKGVPDATFKGGMNWRAPGYFRNQQGIWELGINPKTKVIYHFNFTN